MRSSTVVACRWSWRSPRAKRAIPHFNKLKNWRGIATRYDKHALVYRGGVVLASIMLWLA